MDLRNFITPAQLQKGIELIKNGTLFYQPFILHDDLEIGEGQNFCDAYKDVNSVYDFNVYAKGFDVGERRLAKDKDYFRQCNQEYRDLYLSIIQGIKECSGKEFKNLEFAEIGCNTGLTLFNLASRGAKSCIGYDWNDVSTTFNWLNDILKTDVKFVPGIWNNLTHQFSAGNIPEVDIMINTIYTNHQCDPLQFLSYICDRSRVGVFLWMLISDDNECAIHYPEQPLHDILNTNLPFPLGFNNGTVVSKKLLQISLAKLGFGKMTQVQPNVTPLWDNFCGAFKMFYAERTANVKSAYWMGIDDIIRIERKDNVNTNINVNTNVRISENKNELTTESFLKQLNEKFL